MTTIIFYNSLYEIVDRFRTVNASFDLYTNFCYNSYNKYSKIFLSARMQESIRQITNNFQTLSNIPTL